MFIQLKDHKVHIYCKKDIDASKTSILFLKLALKDELGSHQISQYGRKRAT